jgi:hypothetical protein
MAVFRREGGRTIPGPETIPSMPPDPAPQTATAPTIALVTCLRDEGPFVVDWLAHLRKLGVGTVLAFTNDCADGTEALLDALGGAGLVHVPQGRIEGSEGPAPQWRALGAAWDHPALEGADWIAHLDCDEWIAMDGLADLPALIAALPAGTQAVALPWRLHGWAGRIEPGEGTVPERFPRAAPPGPAYPVAASFFKTLLRRDGPWTGLGVHRPRQAGPATMADDTLTLDPRLGAEGGPIQLWRGGRPPAGRRVQLNHYAVRSIHEFLVKRARGLPNRTRREVGLAYWVERCFDAVPCDWIAPQLPGLRAEAARLRALPGVAAAERACLHWHRAEAARLLATPEGAALAGRLALAGSSRVLGGAEARAMVRLARAAGQEAGR